MECPKQPLHEGPVLPGSALESEPEGDCKSLEPVSECAKEDRPEPVPEQFWQAPELVAHGSGEKVECLPVEGSEIRQAAGGAVAELAPDEFCGNEGISGGASKFPQGASRPVAGITEPGANDTQDESGRGPWSGVDVPEGFQLEEDGVYESGGREKGIAKIAGRVWVSAHTQDDGGVHYGIVVTFVDLRGNLVELAFSREVLHTKDRDLVQCLARRGLAIVPGKEGRVAAYLGSFDSAGGPRRQSARKSGWVDSTEGRLIYVHPAADGGAIPLQDAKQIIFQPEQYSATLNTMRRQGELADWQQQVALPCLNNSYLILALGSAFAAPLLKAAGAESGGIHYYGRSSRGKTTAAQAAASVYGCGADPSDAPDHAYVQRWNATTNGLEALLAAHNDSLLVLDEIHSCEVKDFGTIAYNVSAGKGKATMDRNRNAREQRTWRTLVFSTGEISVKQKIEQDKKTARAGQLVRLIDIPVHENIICDSHDAEPADFVLRLKRACGQYCGSAGPAFIAAITRRFDNFHHFSTYVRHRLAAAEKILVLPNMEPEQRRAVRRFALILVAGELAVEFGILPFNQAVIEGAVKEVVKAWLSEVATIPDPVRGVMAVQDFIQRNPSRFRPLRNEGAIVHQLAGYIERDAMAGAVYLIIPEAFAEACAGHDPAEVARELDRLGLLKTKERGRLTSKHTVPINSESRRLRLYAVSDKILEFDYAEATTAAGTTKANGTGGADGATN